MTDKKKLEIFKEKTNNNDFVNRLLPEVFMNGDVQKFNPKEISKSVINEAGLTQKDAKVVTEFVVRRIIASGIKFLSGPHIRELVCSALSELSFEEERKLFTRIGMPIHDYGTLLKSKYNRRITESEYTGPENIHRWASGQLASEYTMLKILTNSQTRSHLAGDLYIHSLNYFDMRSYSQSWDLRMILKLGFPPTSFLNLTVAKPANNATTAVLHASKWLGFAHSEFSGDQSYLYFNTFIAPYLKGQSYKQIKQIAQIFIYEVNQQNFLQGGHLPISSIVCSPNIPEFLNDIDAIGPGGVNVGTYGDYQEENLSFFNALAEIYSKGDRDGKLFIFPKHKILLNSDLLHNENLCSKIIEETLTMGTPIYIDRSAPWLKNGEYFGPFFTNLQKDEYLKGINGQNLLDWSKNFMNMGALQSISINLPRIAYKANGNDETLIKFLLEKMNEAKEILLTKYNLIKNSINNKRLPLSSIIIKTRPIFNLHLQALVFSFTGLNEMIKAHTGYEIHENDSALELGKKIMRKMEDQCKIFTEENNIFFTLWKQQNESPSYRFASLDLTHFNKQAKKTVNGNVKDGAVYYTPSADVNYSANIELREKIKIHAQMATILQNNSSLPIWLNNSDRLADFNNITDSVGNLYQRIGDILNDHISEFSFNFDFSYCLKCGQFSKGIHSDCTKCKSKEIKILSKLGKYFKPLELWNKGKREEFYDRKRISL
ncbi:MAG: anaerobic ribonucleoside-triphosphate reductase [Promethearchaeota archaeon]